MRNVLIGVTGGIAAYKSCELVRLLQQRGCNVRVTMTKSACEFVSKLTFEALTQAPVQTDLFGDGAFGTAHIEWARWADVFIVAPATANTIAKLSYGLADDFLTTTMLAHEGRKILVPSMNTKMWENEVTQANLQNLKKRGFRMIEPDSGSLACGEIGAGRMAEPKFILESMEQEWSDRDLQNQKVLITAGATREYIDPVRFISSPSTGRMGFALAEELCFRGADVTVIHGPTGQAQSHSYTCIEVGSAQDMSEAVNSHLPADIFVGAAAVSDYTPRDVSGEKIKKAETGLDLHLERTEDILRTVSSSSSRPKLVVGFAAETQNLERNAETKLREKNLDFIVANEVFKEKKGFARDQISGLILHRSGEKERLNEVSKEDVARKLCDLLSKALK